MGAFDKYFIFKTPPNPIHPQSAQKDSGMNQYNTLYINDEINKTVPGAFYMETNIVVRESPFKDPMDKEHQARPHNHDFNEYMLFLGIDPEDPFELGGEVELWLEDEPHIINKTCAVLIPRLIYHCPIIFHRVDRPFMWITSGDTCRYKAESYNMDPKWDGYHMHGPEVNARLPEWMRIKE